jgi:hypothetical protein
MLHALCYTHARWRVHSRSSVHARVTALTQQPGRELEGKLRLLVSLPSACQGGKLVVSDSVTGKAMCLDEADAEGFDSSFCCFYFECNEELETVTAGNKQAAARVLSLRARARWNVKGAEAALAHRPNWRHPSALSLSGFASAC